MLKSEKGSKQERKWKCCCDQVDACFSRAWGGRFECVLLSVYLSHELFSVIAFSFVYFDKGLSYGSPDCSPSANHFGPFATSQTQPNPTVNELPR